MTDPTAQLGEADEAAVRALYDRHAGPLLGWANKQFADPREAEEAVQDTIVQAWRKADQYDPDRGSERAWLFGILRNTAVSRHRKTGRRLRIVRPVELTDDSAVSPDGHDIELERAEIVDAINALSDDHRVVIVAAYYGGLRIGAIAGDLGVPEGTVKSRLYYGLRKLRAELEERGVLR